MILTGEGGGWETWEGEREEKGGLTQMLGNRGVGAAMMGLVVRGVDDWTQQG